MSSRSLYLEPEAAVGMPDRCQVVGISPFMRSLLAEAVELPADYDLRSRADALMTLIQHEMRRLPALPLSLPFPAHATLAELCRGFLAAPVPHETIDDWSARLRMSRRDIHAALPARDGAELHRLASAGLPCRGAAAPRGGRARHVGGARSRLR